MSDNNGKKRSIDLNRLANRHPPYEIPNCVKTSCYGNFVNSFCFPASACDICDLSIEYQSINTIRNGLDKYFINELSLG